jgi:protein-tyrosine phosphatase
VFVHCVAGISRSASLVIGYLLKYKDYTLKQVIYWNLIKAIKKVKRCRAVVNPNKGFLMQLEEYEKKLIKKNCKKWIYLKYFLRVSKMAW